ncbi:MAG: dihydrodipicolinate synthase family protein [Firmicutes bacterium]|nr:dihydrodipicolinate synthase family protein [Bacillota bacterium]
MLSDMIPIALTPFHPDGSLDLASIGLLARFYQRQGAQAVIVLGIMGEAHALSDRERAAVIEAYAAALQGALPVAATVSAAATEVSIQRAREAAHLGAQFLMVAPPPQVTEPEALLVHFQRVAEATSLPWILQDEPVTTGVKLSVGLIEQLAHTIPTLVAVKIEDVPTAAKIHRLREALPDLQLFGGLGGLYLFEELQHGASGTMTGFSYPDILAQVIAHFRAGRVDDARRHFYRYLPLIRYEAQLGVRGIALRKALFYQRGLLAAPTVRAPATAVDALVEGDLTDLVAALGLSLSPEEGAV